MKFAVEIGLGVLAAGIAWAFFWAGRVYEITQTKTK